jgi:hypothetical protein
MTATTKNNAALAASVQSHIDALTPDMIPIVRNVEHDSMNAGMTQNNYGGYMATLATLCPNNEPRMLYIICAALIAAGGNAAGIKSAAAINSGRDPLQALGL